MHKFPNHIRFCYPWRSYQQSVLEQLHTHLKNNHLHLVAPPGSGKTVLGLEVMQRLNKSTLIIAPTIAIRNQWVERFTELFLQVEATPDWISTDIRNPAFMTVTTYQGLHAIFNREKEDLVAEQLDDMEEETIDVSEPKNDIIQALFKQNFQTLILDEAHHLRTSWWKTLMGFRKKLKSPTIVALTATPPYDVNPSEWEKYIELCGPIDEEIEIAALVKEGDLCPHQDYIYMSTLTNTESVHLTNFRREVNQLIDDLKKNRSFIHKIETHPWIISEQYVNEKIEFYRYYVAMIIFLKEIKSEKWEAAFEQLQIENRSLPPFHLEWMEELLTGIFYKDTHLQINEEPFKSLKKQLSHLGTIERKSVRLIATEPMKRSFVQSASKLNSIVEIISYEQQQLHDDMRLVILADYIYKDDLYDARGQHRLGVIPIFTYIKQKLSTHCKLGVLTGSVVIIPTDAVPLLEQTNLRFTSEPLKDDATYCEIRVQGQSNERIVAMITQLFTVGAIDTLIGTTALLGEGWDAPSVNRLILASYVGSFMLTNQMRGRAIRTDRNNPLKTANIWHLVCVDVDVYDPGNDYISLKRRFDSLNGLDAELPIIVSGLTRLRMPDPPFRMEAIEGINQTMKTRAKNRKDLRERWLLATQLGEKKKEQMDLVKEAIPRPFYYENTIKTLLVLAITTFLGMMIELYFHPRLLNEDRGFVLLLGFLVGMIVSSKYWWTALKIFFQNSSVESSLQTVGMIIYEVLFECGKIETEPRFNKLEIIKLPNGTITCTLERGQMWEQKIFFQALQQFVDPIENPRYLLYRQTGKRFFVRHDYHSIPEAIGYKREIAESFAEKWRQQIGHADAIYTRNFEGRKVLLYARMRAMSSKFIPKSERKDVWK